MRSPGRSPSTARFGPSGSTWTPTCAAAPRGCASSPSEADLLRHGLAEIAAVDPQPGEDAALAAEAHRLAAADDLRAAALAARDALSGESDVDPDGPRRDRPGGGRPARARRRSTTRS